MALPLRTPVLEDSFPVLIDRVLEEAVSQVEPASLREILTDAVAGGKRIRPVLTALACKAAGGDDKDAVIAGAALELLHVSSLVHDDIMDHAATRRGKPTVAAQHGTSVAILAGDALVALSFRLVQSVPHARKDEIQESLTSAFLSLCEGQCADICGQPATAGDPYSHYWMVERKTARLLEACTRTGGVLADAPPKTVQALGKFGLSLGLAYQAMDDLLDVIGTADETGKTVGLDAKNGRRTYLSLAGSNMGRAQQIHAMVEGYTNEACAALDILPLSPARARLHELAHGLVHRRS
jgi:geranylgeranyl pyrophosphate synthase